MQVKVCPNCNTENRTTNAACYKCRTPLTDVQATEGQGTALSQSAARSRAAQQPAPPAPAPTVSMPPSAPEQTQYAPGPPQAPSNQRPVRQQLQYRSEPVAVSTGLHPGIIVLIVLIVVGALGFAYMKSTKTAAMPTEDPKKVVAMFIEAKKTHQLARVRPYLSEISIEKLENTLNSKQAQSAGFNRKEVQNMLLWDAEPSCADLPNLKYILTDITNKDDNKHSKVIEASFVQKKKTLFAMEPTISYVLVAEEGKWKVDLGQSSARTLDPTGSMQRLMPGALK